MNIHPYPSDLPVNGIIADVKQHLADNHTLIVQAPPGAGKSTLLPLTLLNEAFLENRKIIMLEPRRLAARSIAHRMAAMINEPLGDTIGYRIRFENKTSARTRMLVVTEGVLTRMLQTDNALEDVGMVIFDEFHERSIHADLALALCRESQQVLRPDLRILIMSATLDMPQLSSLLQAPVVQSDGRQFPVDIHYVGGQDERLLPETTARTVIDAVRKQDGDALVFLPGEAEIRRTADILGRDLRDFSIHPLYGMLPQHEQIAAIMPNKHGKRKVVLATSIAETSLTIEGVKIVVDTGYTRIQRFDPASGLSRLETVQISKDAAQQRAGRAGRLAPGVCYRMWTAATHARLAEHRIPEIMEADLADLMLDLSQWGISHIGSLCWLNEPPAAHVSQASQVLHELGALEKGRITDHGRQIHQLACHPRIAHMLLLAEEEHTIQLATDVAAVLEEKDPLGRDAGIDINLRVEALRRARQNNSLGKAFTRIEKVAESYRRMLKVEVSNTPVDPFETGLMIAHAYPERIACARPGNNAQFQLANGKYAMAGHKDDLAHEPWLAIAHMDTRDGLGKIFLAAPLNPKDLRPLVKEKEVITWDTRKGGLIASRDLRIGSIVLQSKPIPNPNPDLLVHAISEAIAKEGTRLLNWNDAMLQLQYRILSLGKWNHGSGWPDVSTNTLLLNNEEWLGAYLAQVKRVDDLEKIDLVQALLMWLPYEKQQQLETLAPSRIKVPSGSNISIEYFEHGETPVLAVRLQEVFGMEDTPRINGGHTPLVMHLLSPGYKPVQVTSDLRSFWNNTYHEVRNELKRRYPKHAWPENPWEATPVAKGRPRA